ncbi:zinc finger protein 33B [Folsomia candida]|uniref:zinc finger protein 33B n=1 Tax=Folsomia candida TaxID=158441 RepID=UPI001604E7D2|nr:zinc finger protein 33B [Folsomia candida]
MDSNGGISSEQNETLPLDGMEVNRKLHGRQKALVHTMEKGDHFQENGRLPPHSDQPREPTPRDDNHVQSPSSNSRSLKAKKSAQIGRMGVEPGRRVAGKIFPCKICLRPFTNRSSVYLHARTHLNSEELERSTIFHGKCPYCARTFFIRRDFTHHLFVHMSREERAEVRQGWRHGCYFCTKRFKSQSHLSRHLATQTKEKVGGRCHVCRKTFSSKDGLTSHRFTHLSEDEKVALVKQGMSRECLFCHKKFPNNRAYHAHLVSHTKEKPFLCDQCGNLFVHNYSLKLHKRLHSSNPKRFNCDDCEKAFTSKHNLTSHTKTVHRKLRDFACPECAKKFGMKSDMVRHLRSVHAKIRLPSPLCGKTFTHKGHLGTHLKKVHSSE